MADVRGHPNRAQGTAATGPLPDLYLRLLMGAGQSSGGWVLPSHTRPIYKGPQKGRLPGGHLDLSPVIS